MDRYVVLMELYGFLQARGFLRAMRFSDGAERFFYQSVRFYNAQWESYVNERMNEKHIL